MNDGQVQAVKGNLDAAERSWQRALRLWEELAVRCGAPPEYRMNLALTLYNLGWLREHQARPRRRRGSTSGPCAGRRAGRRGQGRRRVQAVDGRDPAIPGEPCRRPVRRGAGGEGAVRRRKYEEAQVKAKQGAAEAEALYQEAIALWEEVLPRATSADYRKECRTDSPPPTSPSPRCKSNTGKRPQAEASLLKGIAYGEEAVALEPDRPLPRHNLEAARRTLDGLREQRWPKKSVGCSRGAPLRRGDRPLPARRRGAGGAGPVGQGPAACGRRRLAYRLDRFARLLAHCPDPQSRNTRAAVKQARRATELQPDVGDYWYTLAEVQYRNGDWQDSLASLERMKAREGDLDAFGWLLTAMNRHQRRQGDEARAAMRKAAEWVEEQQRKAEGNA